MASSAPRLPTEFKTNTLSFAAGAQLALLCRGQAYPVPSFRCVLFVLRLQSPTVVNGRHRLCLTVASGVLGYKQRRRRRRTLPVEIMTDGLSRTELVLLFWLVSLRQRRSVGRSIPCLTPSQHSASLSPRGCPEPSLTRVSPLCGYCAGSAEPSGSSAPRLTAHQRRLELADGANGTPLTLFCSAQSHPPPAHR